MKRFFLILKDGWMSFSHALGRVMSFILLTILWIIAIGIYAVVAKLLRIGKHKDVTSTWVDIPAGQSDLHRQF